MKVYYPGPGQKTYHPKLGKLITGEDFELADDIARPYVKGGLLKERKKPRRPAVEGENGGLKE